MVKIRGVLGVELTEEQKKGTQPIQPNPFLLLVPGARIELAQRQAPRDFKSLASTSSATQAPCFLRLYNISTENAIKFNSDSSIKDL